MIKNFLFTLLMLTLPSLAWAQFTIPYTFSPNTRALSAQVNANFDALSNALDRRGGTMTGTLTTQNVVPDGAGTRDLGASGTRYANIYSTLGNFSGDVTAGDSILLSGTPDPAVWFTTSNGFILGAADLIFEVDTDDSTPLASWIFRNSDGTNVLTLQEDGDLTYTGRAFFKSYEETFASPAISGGALTLDLSTASHFLVSLNQNITSLSITNPSSSGVSAFTVRFDPDGTQRTITWPASVVWAGGTAPTMTATLLQSDFITFISYDNGATWFGFIAGQNFS